MFAIAPLLLLALLSLHRHVTGQATRDVTVEGIVFRGEPGMATPMRGQVIVHSPDARCQWSTWTEEDGSFARRCDAADIGARISLAVIHTNPPGPSWEGAVQVPPEGTPMATLDIQLATPMTPPPSPTVTDHLGWHHLQGEVRGLGIVEGAEVSIRDSGGGGTAPPLRCLSPVHTDPLGYFEAWCNGGHALYNAYHVRIEADGYLPFVTEVPINHGISLDVALRPKGVVHLPVARKSHDSHP